MNSHTVITDQPKNQKNHRSRFFIRVLPIVLLASVFVHLEKNLIWNITESVNGRLGYLSAGQPSKGDYVHFLFSHDLLAGRQDMEAARDKLTQQFWLTKKLVCVPGDQLKTIARDLYCNGEKIATALQRTGSGKPLAVFLWNGAIPEGKALVLGDSEASFDSRYWGFVDIEKLKKVKLLSARGA